MRQLIIAIALAFASMKSVAEEPIYLQTKELRGLIHHSTLEAVDEVSGNCWTNKSAIHSKVHLLYEQNEIFVPDYEIFSLNAFTASTTMSALGFRTTAGLCAVTATFAVHSLPTSIFQDASDQYEFFAYPYANLFEQSYIATSTGNVNEQLDEFFIGAASAFLASHLSAKRSEAVKLLIANSFILDQPMSKEQYLKLSKEMSGNN